MSKSPSAAMAELVRLLLKHLFAIREASWPGSIDIFREYTHGMLTAMLILGAIDEEQRYRLCQLLYNACNSRERELSRRQEAYGRRFCLKPQEATV